MTKCRGHCAHHNAFIALFLILFGSVVIAEPLYLERVNQANVSEDALQKALKQVKEHKDIDVLDDLTIPPFHKRNARQTSMEQPFCMTCHLPLPHRKNERSRTFMNMHSRYIACETCHFRPEGTALAYRWLAYDGAQAGRPLAPRSATSEAFESALAASDKPQRAHEEQFKKRPPLAPQADARIVPFFNDAPVVLFKASAFALHTQREWDDADEAGRAKLKARLHAPLEKEGPVCNKCHSKNDAMLDLEALGATPERLKAIQDNTIVRFFNRFKNEDERIRINDLLR